MFSLILAFGLVGQFGRAYVPPGVTPEQVRRQNGMARWNEPVTIDRYDPITGKDRFRMPDRGIPRRKPRSTHKEAIRRVQEKAKGIERKPIPRTLKELRQALVFGQAVILVTSNGLFTFQQEDVEKTYKELLAGGDDRGVPIEGIPGTRYLILEPIYLKDRKEPEWYRVLDNKGEDVVVSLQNLWLTDTTPQDKERIKNYDSKKAFFNK